MEDAINANAAKLDDDFLQYMDNLCVKYQRVDHPEDLPDRKIEFTDMPHGWKAALKHYRNGSIQQPTPSRPPASIQLG